MLGIVSQLVIKSALTVACAVQGSESTAVLRNVRITATTIVSVDDRLGVDVGEWLSSPLFLANKLT